MPLRGWFPSISRSFGEPAEKHSLRGYDAVHPAAAELAADEDLVLVAGDGELLRAAATIGLNTARIV